MGWPPNHISCAAVGHSRGFQELCLSLDVHVLEGKTGTGHIMINGGAAHLIKAGERVAIMAFALSETPVNSKNLLLDEKNSVLRTSQ
jgi:aspartate 1-decarboxylase